jgi:hypothetical protein
MPTLPSGISLALSAAPIPERLGPDWFSCPEGHFWYETPDVALSPPPYTPQTQDILMDFKHAPVPTSHAELARYLAVLQQGPDGRWWWAGDTLAAFPRYLLLDDADLAAWRAWLDREETRRAMDEWIERCRRQAASNRDARGFAVFRGTRG